MIDTKPSNDVAIQHPGVGWLEWACQQCGGTGPGFMPEEHASGACEVSKTAIIVAPTGFMDGGGI